MRSQAGHLQRRFSETDLLLHDTTGSLDELLLRLQGNPNICRDDFIHTIETTRLEDRLRRKEGRKEVSS